MFLDKYLGMKGPLSAKEKIVIKGVGQTGHGMVVAISIDTGNPKTSVYLGTHNLTYNSTLIIGEHYEGEVGRSVVAA
jgi:hypothetical protein